MKQCSLRVRLLRIISIPLIIGMAGIGLASYFSAKHEAEEVYDAQLAHFARVLGLLTQHEIEEGDISEKLIHLNTGKFNTPYEKDFAYRVWLKNDIVLQSDNAAPFGPLTQSSGFTDRIIGHTMWRLFILHEGDVIIEVAEDYHARQDLIEKLGLSVLLPFLFILPLLAIVIWGGLRFGIAPLEKLSAFVGTLKPEALKPVELEIIPQEVMPLVTAINQLMQRVEETIEREKRFTGYAAHELRTPLAALKTQVQVALREKNLDAQQEMFKDVEKGIDRMSHLVIQLLTLVRVQETKIDLQPVDLSNLIQEIAATFTEISAQKNQTLRQEIEPAITVMGNPDMLSVLVRNLLDNATRYSPNNADISVALKHQGKDIRLTVSNTGISLSPTQQEQMFEPFYRGGNSEASGAGLGLAITGWVAKQHGARVTCTSEEGVTVAVVF